MVNQSFFETVSFLKAGHEFHFKQDYGDMFLAVSS